MDLKEKSKKGILKYKIVSFGYRSMYTIYFKVHIDNQIISKKTYTENVNLSFSMYLISIIL